MKKFLIGVFAICLLFSVTFAAEGTNRRIKVNKSIIDEIYESGEVDYFNFSISDPGSLQIRFEFDVEGTYTVKLINAENENVIQSTKFSSNVNTTNGRYEKFSNKMRVDEGDYQLQVSRNYFSDCDEDYELEVVYDEEDNDRYEKEYNDKSQNAMLIDYNRDIIGNLESEQDIDYYMVELPEPGELYVEFEFDNTAIYNIEVFSDNNGSLKSLQKTKYEAKLNQNSNTYLGTSERLRVPEGNYYFKISKYWNSFSNEDYTVCVKYLKNTRGNYEIENNNEAKYATEIIPNVEFLGNLSNSDDVDYYRLDVWNANKFTVKMNLPENAQYTVVTYKEVNGELSKLGSETFSSKTLSNLVSGKEQEVSAGSYYFKISSRTYSNKDYTFLVETISEPTKTTIVLEINNPYMTVNGRKCAVDGNRGTTPVILNSRTMLPARAVIEAMGGSVIWNETERGINIYLGGNYIYLMLDNTLAYVNNEAKYLDVAPTSINGRTMVPIKFVMDNLGGSVIWNATSGTVTITY